MPHTGDPPVCAFAGVNKWDVQLCKISRVRRNRKAYCPAGQTSCARADQFQKLDDNGHTQYQADVEHAQEDFNSVTFNAFIFMQVSSTSQDYSIYVYGHIAGRQESLITGCMEFNVALSNI